MPALDQAAMLSPFMRRSPQTRGRPILPPLRAMLAAIFLVGTGLHGPHAAAAAAGETITAADFLEAMRSTGPGQTVSFKNTLIKGQVHATSVGLDTVHATVRLRGITFEEQLALDRVVFTNPVRISKSTFKRGLSMLDARFEHDVSFAKSTFGGHTTFKRAHFMRAARFVDIVGEGMMSFSDALFDGEITDFTRARFLQPAYFDQVAFSNGTSFVDAAFELESSFKEARWDAEVGFAGARFGEEALFRYADFAGDATFDRARFRREVFFDKARFQRPASFRDITFVRTAGFTRTTFLEEADFTHCRFKRDADFGGTDFRAPARLNAYFGRDLILRQATGPLLDLRSLAVAPATERADSTFSDSARVFLHNADFGRMLFDWSRLSGRLATVDSTSSAALDAAYGMVRQHLKAMGLGDDALDAYRESMDRRRQALEWTSPERIWLEIFGMTSSYGTRPGRLLWWAVGVVLLFAVLFKQLSASFSPPPAPGGFLSCVFLSLCVFTRVGVVAKPEGRARLWMAFETVLGWLFLGCFIAICVRLLSS